MNNSEFTNPPSNSDKTVAEKLGITKTGKVTIGILLVILILFASIVAKNFLVVPIPHNSIIVGGNRLFMSFNLGSINYAFSLDQFRIITRTLQRNLREEVEWSPDGKWFASSIEEVVNGRYSTNIYIMRADGSQRTLIPPPDRGYGRQPTWLLNGKQIAYTVLVGGDEDGTYITNVECILREESCVLKPRRLIQPDLGYLVLFPDWSPDGRQIIYHHNGDIFVLNVD